METLFVATAPVQTSETVESNGAESGASVQFDLVAAEDALFALPHPWIDVVYVAEMRGMLRVVGSGGDVMQMMPSGGVAPCHLAIDAEARTLYCVNYSGGSLAVFRLTATGAVSRRLQLISLEPQAHDDRPARPHHVMFAPRLGDAMLVADLGQDRMLKYAVASDGTLQDPVTIWRAREGAPGPRSLAIDRFGYVWCADERSSMVSRLVPADDLSRLHRTHAWPATMVPADGPNHPGFLAASTDGRRLYLANRGADTISVLCADADGLGPIQEVACGGRWPSALAIVGDELYVACRDSHLLTVLSIDPARGTLSTARPVRRIPAPSALAVRAAPA